MTFPKFETEAIRKEFWAGWLEVRGTVWDALRAEGIDKPTLDQYFAKGEQLSQEYIEQWQATHHEELNAHVETSVTPSETLPAESVQNVTENVLPEPENVPNTPETTPERHEVHTTVTAPSTPVPGSSASGLSTRYDHMSEAELQALRQRILSRHATVSGSSAPGSHAGGAEAPSPDTPSTSKGRQLLLWSVTLLLLALSLHLASEASAFFGACQFVADTVRNTTAVILSGSSIATWWIIMSPTFRYALTRS